MHDMQYARLCSRLIKESKFNTIVSNEITFESALISKRYEVFYSYKTINVHNPNNKPTVGAKRNNYGKKMNIETYNYYYYL